MKSKNICIYLLLLLVFSISPVSAAPEDEKLVDRAVQIAKEHPGTERDLINIRSSEIRAINRNAKEDDWQKAEFITLFVTEVENEVFTNQISALKKIDFILDAINTWRQDLALFHPGTHELLAFRESKMLLLRWLLKGNLNDQTLADNKLELLTKIDGEKCNRHDTNRHSTAYAALSHYARALKRPREEQIAIIKKGIQVHLTRENKYPKCNFVDSIDELYLNFDFIPGGVSAKEYVDEWLAYLKTKPIENQVMSSRRIAGALASIDRHAEAIDWVDKYIEFAKELVKNSTGDKLLFESIVETSCSSDGNFSNNLNIFSKNNQRFLAKLDNKICLALSNKNTP
jgi:hypothetical protein